MDGSGCLGERRVNGGLRLASPGATAAHGQRVNAAGGRRGRQRAGSRRQETSTENRCEAAALVERAPRRCCPPRRRAGPRPARARAGAPGPGRSARGRAAGPARRGRCPARRSRRPARRRRRRAGAPWSSASRAACRRLGVAAPGQQEAGRVEPRLGLAQPQVRRASSGPARGGAAKARALTRSQASSSRPGAERQHAHAVGQRRARVGVDPGEVAAHLQQHAGAREAARRPAARREPGRSPCAQTRSGRPPASSIDPVEQRASPNPRRRGRGCDDQLGLGLVRPSSRA